MTFADIVREAYNIAQWVIPAGALILVPFRRKFTAAAWLLLIFFLPIPGLLLFLMIGQPRFPKFRIEQFEKLRPFFTRVCEALSKHQPERSSPVAQFAQHLGYLPETQGNSIELIDDYDEAIRRLIADIDAAQVRVSLLVYIFADDAVAQSVIAALGRAVARGVDCKVLLDPVGSVKWVRRTVRRLRDVGVHTREALPWRWIWRRTRRDMRNHRKLFIIDGRIGYAGSQNLVAKDFRPGVVNRELMARCTGPVIAAMEAVFLADWFAETGTAPPESIEPPAPTGESVLQLLPSGPEYPLEGFETLLVWQLHQARQRAIIATPYFIPDQDVLGAMRTAVARGVEIDMVLSRVADHPIVNLAQRSYYDDLLKAGVRIHLFKRYLLHAKNVSFDGELAIVGSSNVDLRSFELNEEVSLLLLDSASVTKLEAVQRGYIENSEQLKLETWAKRSRAVMVVENLARLVSPLL
jgi:cardiolipin synthase A/B